MGGTLGSKNSGVEAPSLRLRPWHSPALGLRLWLFNDTHQSPHRGRIFEGLGAVESLMGAVEVDDLRMPPSNRLEALTGDLTGKWSIRVNDRWRLCFRFEHGHAHDVEIVDYH